MKRADLKNTTSSTLNTTFRIRGIDVKILALPEQEQLNIRETKQV